MGIPLVGGAGDERVLLALRAAVEVPDDIDVHQSNYVSFGGPSVGAIYWLL